MNRWTARILGLILIIIFAVLMMKLQRQLVMLQQRAGNPTATTTR